MSMKLLPTGFLADLRDAAAELRSDSDKSVLTAMLEKYNLEASSEEAFDEMRIALERHLDSGHGDFDAYKRVLKNSVRERAPGRALLADAILHSGKPTVSADIDLEDAAQRKTLATAIQDGAWAAAQRAMQDETVEILLRYGLVTASDEALSQMVSAIRHEDDGALDSIIKSDLTPKDGPANTEGMTP